MSYALRRGRQWITAPEGEGPAGQIIPPVLAADDDPTHAWIFPTLDVAIERQQLLRHCWGLSTEIRTIR